MSKNYTGRASIPELSLWYTLLPLLNLDVFFHNEFERLSFNPLPLEFQSLPLDFLNWNGFHVANGSASHVGEN